MIVPTGAELTGWMISELAYRQQKVLAVDREIQDEV
jgi:hypothetical protein